MVTSSTDDPPTLASPGDRASTPLRSHPPASDAPGSDDSYVRASFDSTAFPSARQSTDMAESTSGGRRRRSKARDTDGASGASHRQKLEGGPHDDYGDDVELDFLSDEDLHDDEETGLTAADKQRLRDRRRHNAQLDQRVAKETLTAAEKRQADTNVVKTACINGLLIGMWYLFSLSISIYNKWMFSSDHLNFHYPLFTTCIHMVVQFCLAGLVLLIFPKYRPSSTPATHDAATRGEYSQPGEKKPLMTKMFYLTRIAPCGIATGLDIGLGNTSLKIITLTFYTMCKSSSLAFVLLFAFVFRLEQPSWKLIAIIATMTLGVVMMVAGEVNFALTGFALIISSSFFSGFRWALTQILLLRNPATSNPFSSIFFLTPVMFLSMFVIAIPAEGFSNFAYGIHVLVLREKWRAPLILLFPGFLAFMMTSSEYALLKRTSVVTLSICGIFKEVVTISAAALVFHDPLTPINISGLLVTLAAIASYNYIKITKMRADARSAAHHPRPGRPASDLDVDAVEFDAQDEGVVTSDGEIRPLARTPQDGVVMGESSGRDMHD